MTDKEAQVQAYVEPLVDKLRVLQLTWEGEPSTPMGQVMQDLLAYLDGLLEILAE